jgi:hypothetical protein
MDAIDTTTGNPIKVDDGQTPEEVETQPEDDTMVELETDKTPSTEIKPSAPSQILDPITELEKVQGLDPKVKELLKSGFMRQVDYTKKTQEIAEIRKEHDRLVAERENANRLPVKTEDKPTEVEFSDDPKEFAKQLEERAVNKALDIIRGEIKSQNENNEKITHFNNDVDEASKLDARLTTDDSFATRIAGIIQVKYAENIKSGSMTVKEATQKALDEDKAYEESVRQKTLSDVTDKTKKRTMVIPKGNGSSTETAPKTHARTMQEAAAMAEEELSR